MSGDTTLLAAPAIRLSEQARQGDMVEAALVNAMRDGASDLTAFELEDEVRRQFGEHFTANIISRIVANLVAAGRVVQDKEDRRPSAGSVYRPQGSRVRSCRLSVPGIRPPARMVAAVAAGECY